MLEWKATCKLFENQGPARCLATSALIRWYGRFRRRQFALQASGPGESMFLSRIPKLGVEVLTVLAVVMCAGAFAQQQIVLTNVTVIDGTGRPAQRNSTVVIKGDRIQAIGAGHERTPSSAKVIDLQGATIMPLIINTHGHLGLTEGTTQSAANQTDDNFRHQLLRYQEYGVGTVLSMGTDGKRFAEIREESRRGTLPGADVYTAGIGFGSKNGVPPASMGFTEVFRPETPAEARSEVAQQVAQKPDFIKVWVDDFWGQYPKLPPEIYGAIIDEAHRHGLRVAAHVYHLQDSGATPIRIQGFAEHMELALMVQAGLTPIQAITVASLNGAKLLHIEDQYGTLAAGKKANFIVLEKDPSQDIHNSQTIRAVWKDGKKVSDGPLAAGASAMLR